MDMDRPLLGASNDNSQQSQLSSVVRSHEFHSIILDQPEGCLIEPTVTLADVCRVGTGNRPVSWDPGTESGIEDPGRHGRFMGLIPIVVIEFPPYPSRGGASRWLWNDHGEGSAGPPAHDLGPFLFSRSNELHVEL